MSSAATPTTVDLSNFITDQRFACHCQLQDSTKNTVTKCMGKVYDVIAFIISSLDLVTDVLVMIRWYQQGRFGYFYISLFILMLSQIVYAMAFAKKVGKNASLIKKLTLFLISLPFAPIISFVLYSTAQFSKDCFFNKALFACLKVNNDIAFDKSTYEKEASIKQWAHEKFAKHYGFLLEAFFESFPQVW